MNKKTKSEEIEKRIVDFINVFKEDNKKEIERLFTEKCCYHFAVILATQFKGEIWYSPVDSHFICKIDEKLYDITGRYEVDEKVYSWINYQEIEPLESEKIIKNCVDLL